MWFRDATVEADENYFRFHFPVNTITSNFYSMPVRGRGARARGSNTTDTRGRGRGQGTRSASTGEKGGEPILESPAPVTIGRPQRPNANTHPGQIIRDNTQQRRTSEQVQQDKAKAAAATALASKNKVQKAKATVKHLAEEEDRMAQEDLVYAKHAARPDLQVPERPLKKSKLIKCMWLVLGA